jgi:hypothetical protein
VQFNATSPDDHCVSHGFDAANVDTSAGARKLSNPANEPLAANFHLNLKLNGDTTATAALVRNSGWD